MNRVDFMQQLESLLQNIAPMEREEALQYYNDYFDDAGRENEKEVIEALGNPARVAENIKRDLLGSGYGDGNLRKARASDRALVEYGKEIPDAAENMTDMAESKMTGNMAESGTAGNMAEGGMSGGIAEAAANHPSSGITDGNEAGGSGAFGNTVAGSGLLGTTGGVVQGDDRSAAFRNTADENKPSGSSPYYDNTSYGTGAYDSAAVSPQMPSGSRDGKSGLPGWAIALLVLALVLASPVLLGAVTGAAGVVLGAVGALVGVFAAWFAMIAAFGAVFISMFVLLVVLVVIGFMCLFSNPWVGLALIGSGLVCGGIGLLFLMLTVAMAGIATPAIFRGIGHVFRLIFGKSGKCVQRG